MINSLKYYETLKSAEVPDSQARAIARVIENVIEDSEIERTKHLAAKADVFKLEGKMSDVATALRQEISNLSNKLDMSSASLRAEINSSKIETIRWMVGLWVAQLGIVFAMIRSLK